MPSHTPNSLLSNLQAKSRTLEKWLLMHGAPPSPRWNLPNFLGIGAAKAGTTWLHQQLRHHPDIFVSSTKEIHYFDTHYFDESVGSYARHFRRSEQKVRGEITPGYGIIPIERVRFVHRLMPDLKLLLMIRNPVERAWSHALMFLARDRTLDQIEDFEFYKHFFNPNQRARCDYASMADRWLQYYPKDRLFVGFFEDVRQRPRELLCDVFRHLGVTEDVDWSLFPTSEVIRGGVGYQMPDRFREVLEGLHAANIERMIERFGPRCEAWRPAKRTRTTPSGE